MILYLFLAFAIIPIAEIYVLIKIGGLIGALNTVLVVILTAAVGAYLARHEGVRTLLRIRESLRRGIMPADELIEAVMIFIAGIVLLTPGFITDLTGFLILIPPTRAGLRSWLRRKFTEWLSRGGGHHDGPYRFH
jgi:UPF0716 protein FxsA